MTPEEISTLENKVFRLECEQMKWREFRSKVEGIVQLNDITGHILEYEWEELKKELESIKYY